jgi:hypothetical protein
MKRSQLPKSKKLRERAHELKLKADHFLKDADELIGQAEEIERQEAKAKSQPKTKREDVNQAAFRVMRESV